MNSNPQRRRSITRVLVAAVIGILGLTTFGSTASAFEIHVSEIVQRPCGADAPWSASITVSSADYGTQWSTSYEIVGGASSVPSPLQQDIVPFFYDLGSFPATTASVTVNVFATWFNDAGQVGAARTIELFRPATTECPVTTPTAPTVSYSCVTDALAIVGATDTATVDYTVTVTTPPAGEGSTWAVTVTAAPQPGVQFPPGATTTWNFSGTVDCLTPTTPATPTVSYSCVTDALAIVGATDTATVDYTVTVTTPPAGEGSTWAVTVTAAPQPGFEFPPGTTTSWDFSGTVDCVGPVTPTAPTVSYSCVTDALAIVGATDTATVDYTVTVTTPPAGEGSTWAVTVTAAPQPGVQFPPGATTSWDFSGTVDCLTPTTPTTPTVIYSCVTDALTVPGATDTATVDYTVTITTPPAGEGSTWAVTVTAAPQPGFEFPPGTTTTWNLTGTVNCLAPTTPTTPTAAYDCVAGAIVVTGAVDTATVDYTVTVTTPPAGEGSTWAVTVTAAPQPGFEFPPGTTTTWSLTGTVNCVTGEVDPPTTTATTTTTTLPPGATTTVPSTPTTTSNESGAGATTTVPVSGRLPVTGSSPSMLFSWAIVITALGALLLLLRRAPRRTGA